MGNGGRTYSGWRGVQDPSYSLLAASYEPVEGHLAIRFKSGIYVFEGVPEHKYTCLIRSIYAGAYFRTQIKDKYPCIDPLGNLLPAKVDNSPVKRKQAKQAKQAKARLDAVPSMTMNLFGEVEPGKPQKQEKRHSNGG
jgi:hypothetical protein